jgi:hypothetical protein
VIPTELKTSQQSVSQGSLLNIGRGGGMVGTRDPLPSGDRIRLRVGGRGTSGSEAIVLFGRPVWCRVGDSKNSRYGIAFLRGQAESYERLWRFQEISHANLVAKLLGFAVVDLSPSMVETRTLRYINRDLAFSLNCMPIKLRGERLMVAMAEPSERAVKMLELFSRCKIVPVVATPSAIRNALVQCFGVRYVPCGEERSQDLLPRRLWKQRKPRIIALASSAPDFSGSQLATSLASLLNRQEKRAHLAELDPDRPGHFGGISGARAGPGECIILTLSMDQGVLGLDWFVRADEALLVLSPSQWQTGAHYVEAVFDRFVAIHRHGGTGCRDDRGHRRVLEFSVACARISDLQQGFRLFSELETRLHKALDMREPGFDIRVYYLGGILDDKRGIEKAEKKGVPITTLKPRSPASQCIHHMARSLLRPIHARDPRIELSESLVSKILG